MRALHDVWAAAGGDEGKLERVEFRGPDHALPSCFNATPVAAGVTAAAALAGTQPSRLVVDTTHAALSCRSERYLRATETIHRPDVLGGDNPTADGWIRVHSLYAHHRAAASRVLGVVEERDPWVAAIREWKAVDLETAVVEAGGASGAMRTLDEWLAHPHGSQVRDLPLVVTAPTGDAPAMNVEGARIVDLTRVIAGPTSTKYLAACGADVVRVEPPAFDELPVLTVDTGFGKSVARLDLRDADDRATFEGMVRSADALVHGLRPSALDRLGYGEDALRSLRPGLVTGTLSAWGSAGPWAERRGFDALVQMASGIAAEGMARANADRPFPLPMQLLDHATAYLLATGIALALRNEGARRVEVSLARTAAWIQDLGTVDALDVPEPSGETVASYVSTMDSPWGELRYLRPVGADYRSPPPR